MEINKKKFIDFWSNKKVLITGVSGFKGSWLSIILKRYNVKIYGIGLNPETKSLFNYAKVDRLVKFKKLDIRDIKTLNIYIKKISPDIVIHMAAQPLVIYSYANPIETFETNVQGTVNLLNCLRNVKNLQAILNVTTDKVYSNNNKKKKFFKETDLLGGNDPYSGSKTCSEIVAETFRNSYFTNENVALSTARAGNVIGGGDWSSNRLIPDLIRSWHYERTLFVRNQNYIRPWQHVLDPLFGYLILVYKSSNNRKLAGSYNFAPSKQSCVPVKKIINLAGSYFKYKKVKIDNRKKVKESKFLNLNSEKANIKLNFKSKLTLETTIDLTIKWYLDFFNNENCRKISNKNIDFYLNE